MLESTKRELSDDMDDPLEMRVESFFKKIESEVAWVAQLDERLTLDFGSGYDPRVVGSSPTSDSVMSVKPASDSLFLPLPLSLTCILSLSLSLSLSQNEKQQTNKKNQQLKKYKVLSTTS